MAIKRYKANKDNTITNAFDETLSLRGTGSNMGQADILEVFSIYGQATTSSAELSRALIQFDITEVATDRTNNTIPASGSVNFFLKLYNAEHPHTLPRDYKISINAISGSWEEGRGLDMESYKDITNDKIGSNWVNANGTLATATATLDLTADIVLTASDVGYGPNARSFTIQVAAAANNASGDLNAVFTGTPAAIVLTITPFNNGSGTTYNITTAQIVELINTGTVAALAGNITVTDSSSLRALQTATGGGGTNVADSGEGDNVSASFSGGNGKWKHEGGGYYTDLSSSFEQTFTVGDEDLEVDVTPLVEQWINSAGNILGSKENHGFILRLATAYEASSSVQAGGTALLSNYTKKFFARSSEFHFEQPRLEARWDSTTKDNRGNFYFSSSLAPASDNLNTIYLYNYVRGKLTNIPSLGATEPIYVSVFSGSAADDEPTASALALSVDDQSAGGVNAGSTFVVTGGYVSTGIYSASFAYTGSSTLETIYDVWFSGSNSTAHAKSSGVIQLHTSSIKPFTLESSNINPNGKYVVSMPYLKDRYSDKETERFRLYVRNKDWSPNIYTVAQSTPETLIIESASYQVTRTVDQKIVIPYGTGSSDNNYSMLSYDVSGNYFDLDMTMLEAGYTYGLQYSFYEDSVSSYRQQPYLFKFRVEKDEY